MFDNQAPIKDGTYQIKNGEIFDYSEKWSYGYLVGVESLAVGNIGRHPYESELRHLAKNKGLVGVWYDTKGGQCYVDRVKHVDALADALELGRFHGELAIWDIRENKEIRL